MNLFDKNLLEEFSDRPPAGDFIRYDPVFDDLKDQRSQFIEILKSSGHRNELQSICSNFRDKVTNLLETKSKDFLLVVWLVEATTLIESYKGLEASSVFLKDFLQQFWEIAHPGEDEHGLKMSVMQWFDKEFSKNLKFIYLFGMENNYGQNFSKASLDALQREYRKWDKIPERTMTREQRLEYAEVKADWENYKVFCSALQEPKLSQDVYFIENAIKNFDTAEQIIEEFTSQEVPIFDAIRSTLSDLKLTLEKTIRNISKAAVNLDDPKTEGEIKTNDLVHASVQDQATNFQAQFNAKAVTEKYIGDLVDKDEVYKIISLLVERLAVVDPSSPNVQLGKKILKIKDMNFLDILEELVDDERARRHVVRFFGIDGGE